MSYEENFSDPEFERYGKYGNCPDCGTPLDLIILIVRCFKCIIYLLPLTSTILIKNRIFVHSSLYCSIAHLKILGVAAVATIYIFSYYYWVFLFLRYFSRIPAFLKLFTFCFNCFGKS